MMEWWFILGDRSKRKGRYLIRNLNIGNYYLLEFFFILFEVIGNDGNGKNRRSRIWKDL